MKTNHIMGCFHKQGVNADYECPFHERKEKDEAIKKTME